MKFSIEKVDPSSQEEVICFLQKHENYALFLLGNLAAHGVTLSEAPNSANFQLIRSSQKIVAVFALTRRGNLLVQASLQESIFDILLQACLAEKVPLTGLLGEWNFCSSFWKFLKTKKIITTDIFTTKEILYSKQIPSFTDIIQAPVRYLTAKDYPQWKILRFDYLAEEGIPHDLTSEQLHEQFLTKAQEKIIWGYFCQDTLVSIAELNAKAIGIGQVGGVYTAPLFRKKGYAKAILSQMMIDVRKTHNLHKLLIFTQENNNASNRLYESLEASRIGYFAMFFGS